MFYFIEEKRKNSFRQRKWFTKERRNRIVKF